MRDAETFLGAPGGAVIVGCYAQDNNGPGFGILTAAPPVKRRGTWTTHFIDVSNNNGSAIDFREIAHNSRKTGITGVLMKATEGTAFTDPFFHVWRDEAERWGLRTCAYHFARPDWNPSLNGALQEAVRFCRTVGKVRAGEWRPMLDFETAPFAEAWAREWSRVVTQRLGVAPTFYSYTAAIQTMKLAKPLGDGLVIAYPNGQPKVAPTPKPWRRWLAHQYSWHGQVAGVPGEVDLDWTPNVWGMLAFPVRGAALEPLYAARRRRA